MPVELQDLKIVETQFLLLKKLIKFTIEAYYKTFYDIIYCHHSHVRYGTGRRTVRPYMYCVQYYSHAPVAATGGSLAHQPPCP